LKTRRLGALLLGLTLVACGGPSANVYHGKLGEPEYRIGVADVVAVSVKDNPDFSTKGTAVRPDGKITLPIVDDVRAIGLTPEELKAEAVRKLEPFIRTPIVTVTLVELHSYEFFVTGNVARPNRYNSNRLVTVLQALAMAGGLTAFADTEEIVVIRRFPEGQKRIPFDYPAVVNGTRIDQNIYLQSGDTVVVP